MLLPAQLVQYGADKAVGVLGIGLHVGHDHLDIDIFVGTAAPAVVVGGHTDHLVGYLGLAGQLRLGQGRHVDDGAAPRAVEIGLGARGELRALHADEQALVVQAHAIALERVAALAHNGGQARIEGVAEPDVADHAAFEEGEGADALGAVDDLVGHHEVARADVLLQRPDGGEGDDGAHTEVPQGGHVGLVLDLVRREFMVQAVARQEGDGDVVARARRGVVQDGDGRRRRAPRRVDVECGREREAGERLDTRAAYHGNADRRVVR